MAFITIIVGLMLFSLILSKSYKQNDNKIVNIVKKLILGIMYFIIYFVAYYFIVAFITMIPLAFLSRNSEGDSGLWAYAIILGVALSPILSLISTSKTLKKKLK